MRAALLAVPMLALACRAPEAPDNFEEMLNYGFVNYDQDDSYMIALADKLVPWAENNLEALGEGYAIDPLTYEVFEQADLLDYATEDEVVGAAGVATYTSPLIDVGDGLTWPDMSEIYSASLAHEVTTSTDRDCFVDQSCPSVEADIWDQGELSLPLLGSITTEYTEHRGHRWVTLEDGSQVLISRKLRPDPIEFDSNLVQVDQTYSFAFIYPSSDVFVRVEAIWFNGRLVGLDMPESTLVTSTVGVMQTAADELDVWVSNGK